MPPAGAPVEDPRKRASERADGRREKESAMTPESLSSFEQMLTSFAYSPVGVATTVRGDDSAAGGTSKKHKKRKEVATPKGEKRNPAPPQTPPRQTRRRGGPLSLPQPDGAAGRNGTTAAEWTVTMADDSTLATASVAVEDERRQRRQELVVPLTGPRTPLVLSPDNGKHENPGSLSSDRRNDADGKPAVTFSRFFPRHHASASTDGEGKAGDSCGEEGQIEHTEAASEEGKNEPFPDDGVNERNQIDATNITKKRRKRYCEGALRPPNKNEVGRGGERKSKKKKKIVVVSSYFTAPSSKQRVLEGGADIGDEVEVVVQRTKRKRTSWAMESVAKPRTSSSRDQCRRKVADGEKRKGKHQPIQLSAEERVADAYKRVPDDNPWVPPFSVHELLQEFHFFDHWRVLVICMLLNRTTGRKVQKVLPKLFLLCPDAETTMKVSEEEIEEIIRHLGLQKKRSKMIKQMSSEYLRPEWTHVTQLPGIGKYAADAYAIFCSGKWKEVKPNDHKLVDYWRFLLNDKDARDSLMVQKST